MWWKKIAALKQQLNEVQAELQKEQGKAARLSGFLARLQAFGVTGAGKASATMAKAVERTLGSRISSDGLRTKRSYWATMLTRSRNTALTVSCQLQSDSG